MLEDRPILHKTLIGAGAFSFIFAAAMGGTAFMISGGFGLGGEQPHTSGLHEPAQLVSEVQDTWGDWAAPPTDARTMPTSLSAQTPDEPWVDPTPTAASDLDGQGSQVADATPAPQSDVWQADASDAQTDDPSFQDGDDSGDDKGADDPGF